MNPQTVNVPLIGMNQQMPATAGPVGRLKRLTNSIAKRFQGPGVGLRTEKRDGVTQEPIAVRDPVTGLVSAKNFSNSSLLKSFGDRLTVIAGDSPRVLSEGASGWLAPDTLTPTKVLRTRNISTNNVAVKSLAPDRARLGNLTLFSFASDAGVGAYTIVDDDGTVVSPPILSIGGIPKTVADATRFWLVADIGGVLQATVIDTNGTILGAGPVGLTPGSKFDVTPVNGGNGVLVIQQRNGAPGVSFTVFSWNGAAVVVTTTNVATYLCSSGRLAFLKNDRGDSNYYIATIDGAGPFDYYAWQVNGATFASLHQYTVALAQVAAPINITGHVAVTGAANVTVVYSFLDTIPDVRRNFSTIYTVTFAGVATLQRTQRSLKLVSRPFQLLVPDGTYYVVMYYQSDSAATSAQQSTFFLVQLSAPWRVCGRWEYGTAYADWGVTYYLSTPNVAADGSVRLHLTYRATSFTARKAIRFGDDLSWWDTRANTIGLRDYSFGPDHGQAVEFDGGGLLPGPQAVAFDGANFVEDGIPLSPEILTVANGGVGGFLTLLSRAEYVAVGEWTDANGNRVRGPASPPVSGTLTGGNNAFTVTGLMIHVSSKANLTIALYRTYYSSGTTPTQSVSHRKIISDLVPLLNDDGVATWSYTDGLQDTAVAVNEELYTDKGLLDRFPAPPFSDGCIAKGRAFVIGPDGAVWFSGEKTEGDPYWFTPLFRIPVPTNEKLTKVRAIDNILVIFTAKTSAFWIPISQLPDSTGAGAIPRAEELPLSSGCTGFADTIDAGIVYSSSQGGLWMLTRNLENVFIGKNVQDDTAGSPVAGIVSDQGQKLYAVLANGTLLTYDAISQSWSVYTFVVTPKLIALYKGRLVYLSSEATATVWKQVPGQYSDIDAAGVKTAIAQGIAIERINFGLVRNYKRLWQAQLEGAYLGSHALIVGATYYIDERDTFPGSAYLIGPVAGQPYVFELPPQYEEISAIEYSITEIGVVDSAGFALEDFSFEVGVEGGRMGNVPATRRISP